jgi:hypothetical protein
MQSSIENQFTTYNCSLDKFLDSNFYEEITYIIMNNKNHNSNLGYVFFVNQIISKQIRNFLMSFPFNPAGKPDIDSFQFHGIKFRVERNTVSNINVIRPDVKLIVPQDYHKVILLNIN